MIKGVANVWVPVQDIERALAFYQNTLGFSLIKRDGPWAEVDASGLNIGLNGREPEGTQSSGGPVITFQPEAGLDTAVEDLKGKDVQFPAGISEHDRGRIATCNDSEGNDLQLYEPPRS
jgi:predicted enzyme related to lactoylglutathione lyase